MLRYYNYLPATIDFNSSNLNFFFFYFVTQIKKKKHLKIKHCKNTKTKTQHSGARTQTACPVSLFIKADALIFVHTHKREHITHTQTQHTHTHVQYYITRMFLYSISYLNKKSDKALGLLLQLNTKGDEISVFVNRRLNTFRLHITPDLLSTLLPSILSYIGCI